MNAQRLRQLAAVVGVVAEEPLDDRPARVYLVRAPEIASDLVAKHVEGPSVQAALNHAERRVQGIDKLIGPAGMVGVVLPAEARRVREWRLLGAGLAEDESRAARPTWPR